MRVTVTITTPDFPQPVSEHTPGPWKYDGHVQIVEVDRPSRPLTRG